MPRSAPRWHPWPERLPEGVDLEAARRFVAGQDRVGARLLMDVLRLEQRAALQAMQSMERLGDIDRPKRRLEWKFHPDQAVASEIEREVVFRRLRQIVQEVKDA